MCSPARTVSLKQKATGALAAQAAGRLPQGELHSGFISLLAAPWPREIEVKFKESFSKKESKQ